MKSLSISNTALSLALLILVGRTLAEDVKDALNPPSSAPGSGSSSSPAPSPSPSSDPVIESAPESVVIPPGRPSWVEAERNQTGGTHTIPVSSGPYKTHGECVRTLDQALAAATGQYIAEHLGSDLASKFLAPAYDAKTIKRRFIKPENLYEETIVSPSVGPMKQIHALLEFDPNFRDELDQSWARVRATSRLTQTGLFAGAALMLLASVFGYFRLDNATRGYYTGRLQFLTAAAILAVVGVGMVLARYITWL